MPCIFVPIISLTYHAPLLTFQKILYTSSDTSIKVWWKNYTEDVSGIKDMKVSLREGTSCKNHDTAGELEAYITVPNGTLEYSFTGQGLKGSIPCLYGQPSLLQYPLSAWPALLA